MLKGTAVIVGRFQIPKLHKGHRALLYAGLQYESLLVLVGSGPVTDDHDPLPAAVRIAMLEKWLLPRTAQPYSIGVIEDHASDTVWYANLERLCEDEESPVLLGGEHDSFLKSYTGSMPTRVVPSVPGISATQVRSRVVPKNNRDFRAGMVYASRLPYPTSFQCVDMVIRNPRTDQYLMVRKPGMKTWGFVGGFVDPTDFSLEDAGIRELREEVGLDQWEVGYPRYVASLRVVDWRYRNRTNQVMTAVMYAEYKSGKPYAADDVEECRWVSASDVLACAGVNAQQMFRLVDQHLTGSTGA